MQVDSNPSTGGTGNTPPVSPPQGSNGGSVTGPGYGGGGGGAIGSGTNGGPGGNGAGFTSNVFGWW